MVGTAPTRGRLNRRTVIPKLNNDSKSKSKEREGARNGSNHKFVNPYIKNPVSAVAKNVSAPEKVREKFSRNKINKNFLDNQDGDVMIVEASTRKSNIKDSKVNENLDEKSDEKEHFDPAIEVKVPTKSRSPSRSRSPFRAPKDQLD